jgi:hypothetical protein
MSMPSIIPNRDGAQGTRDAMMAAHSHHASQLADHETRLDGLDDRLDSHADSINDAHDRLDHHASLINHALDQLEGPHGHPHAGGEDNEQ